MNSFEIPENQEGGAEKTEKKLKSERIQKLVDRLRTVEGKNFEITENEREYTVIAHKDHGTEALVIMKSGDEETDEGAIFSEIMSPELNKDYLGTPKIEEE
ncbi:MAG: hypothetical protein KGJ13_04840 [Patescibacteria group bacterium]|nr:hypothetical protein [Patescibacteria group bacterium]